jgi:hypothetical protein
MMAPLLKENTERERERERERVREREREREREKTTSQGLPKFLVEVCMME